MHIMEDDDNIVDTVNINVIYLHYDPERYVKYGYIKMLCVNSI